MNKAKEKMKNLKAPKCVTSNPKWVDRGRTPPN